MANTETAILAPSRVRHLIIESMGLWNADRRAEYLSGDVLTQKDVLEAYAIDRIMDPRTLAALNAR